jgi:hypothetical protein
VGAVFYNLGNAASLTGMAPTPLLGGLFTNATLPAGLNGAGIYMIWNGTPGIDNRYVGISTNLNQRFRSRMSVVTELGFDAAQMDDIVVFWGTVATQGSAPGSAITAVANYAAPFRVQIDGAWINLERLLIRYFLTQFPHGQSVSNNALSTVAYANPTMNPIAVQVQWGGIVGTPLNAGQHQAMWPPGGAGW